MLFITYQASKLSRQFYDQLWWHMLVLLLTWLCIINFNSMDFLNVLHINNRLRMGLLNLPMATWRDSRQIPCPKLHQKLTSESTYTLYPIIHHDTSFLIPWHDYTTDWELPSSINTWVMWLSNAIINLHAALKLPCGRETGNKESTSGGLNWESI